MTYIFFFRLSAQGQVIGTNLSMFFDNVPTPLRFGMYIHHLCSLSSLEFYNLMTYIAYI